MSPSRPPDIRGLLGLPADDADSDEEEEAREENREEDEEIDVELILSEEDHAVAGLPRVGVVRARGAVARHERQEEAGVAQVVDVVGQREYEPVPEVAHHQERVLLVDGDEGREAAGGELVPEEHLRVVPLRALRRHVVAGAGGTGGGRGGARREHLDARQPRPPGQLLVLLGPPQVPLIHFDLPTTYTFSSKP